MVYKKHGMKKKYTAGEATAYISRKNARKKLQLSLADFRRLCILKGIYPREPKSRKKAGKGAASNRTYYYTKDIQFLLHEPLIERFRAHKIFLKKLKKAEGRRDWKKADQVRDTRPLYNMDHIVLERYPTFNDALRDMDDALTMIFMFARIPKSSTVHAELVANCRRIAFEWMNYCIHAQCIRKVFVSIKGYYYQVELKGETITWLVAHEFAQEHNEDVDYKVMRTFTEFYTNVASFILYKFYTEDNLKYPPIGQNDYSDDELVKRQQSDLESLTLELRKSKTVEAPEDDIDELAAATGDEGLQKAIEQEKSQRAQKNIFKGCKVFISRESPRAPLAFLLRSLGAEVSWDKELYPGATFNSDDDCVTHLVIDRPTAPQKLGRQAVQPQWVFDSVNFGGLMPTNDYVPGAELPPHLSPFVKEGQYVPPDMEILQSKARGEDPGIGKDSDEEVDEESDDDAEELEEDDDEQTEEAAEPPAKKMAKVAIEEEKPNKPTEFKKRDVKAAGRDKKEPKQDVIEAEKNKLARAAQTSKKRKRLLERIEKSERKDRGRIEKLTTKRVNIDSQKKVDAKKSKKAAKSN